METPHSSWQLAEVKCDATAAAWTPPRHPLTVLPHALTTDAGHLTCVKLLLDEGADIEQRNVVSSSSRPQHCRQRSACAASSTSPGVHTHLLCVCLWVNGTLHVHYSLELRRQTPWDPCMALPIDG